MGGVVGDDDGQDVADIRGRLGRQSQLYGVFGHPEWFLWYLVFVVDHSCLQLWGKKKRWMSLSSLNSVLLLYCFYRVFCRHLLAKMKMILIRNNEYRNNDLIQSQKHII